MTNIEKLYELAKATKYRAVSIYNPIIGYGDYETIEEASSYGDGFKVEKVNSKFTESKQLELIKLISSEFTVRINSNKDSTFIMLMQSAKTFLWASDDKFEQALAKLVCELWEYLKKKAKEEVRGILQ